MAIYGSPLTSAVVQRRPSAPGPAGTYATVELLRDLIDEWSAHPAVRDLAERITEDTEEHNSYAQACAVFSWAKGATRYTQDPVGHELVRDPGRLLLTLENGRRPAIDCEEYVLLLGSLLAAVGVDVRARKVGWGGVESYQHVFLEALVRPGFGEAPYWMPLDPCVPGLQAGERGPLGSFEVTVPLTDGEGLGMTTDDVTAALKAAGYDDATIAEIVADPQALAQAKLDLGPAAPSIPYVKIGVVLAALAVAYYIWRASR